MERKLGFDVTEKSGCGCAGPIEAAVNVEHNVSAATNV
jgi:hypothetical protein